MFGFTDRRLWTPVGDLSGGERRRLQMLRLLAGEPNVLLLDEPTNDLDTDTLAALEDLLDSWPGTMVVASHDRYLVERVTDTVVRRCSATAGWCTCPAGSTSTWPGCRAAPARRAGRAASTAAPAAPSASGMSAAEVRAARKELARLERQLGKLDQREAQLHDQLADARHRLREGRRAGRRAAGDLRAERERIEEAWLTLAERGAARADRPGARARAVCGVTRPRARQSSATPDRTALEIQTWRTSRSTTPRGRSTGRSAG